MATPHNVKIRSPLLGWLITVACLLGGLLFAEAVPATFDYDGQNRRTVAYEDETFLPTCVYDEALVSTQHGRKDVSIVNCPLFVGRDKFLAKKAAVTASRAVWALGEFERGIAVEDRLAATGYKEWFRAGALDNGKFPLVDFQKGNTLLSLKTVDTTTSHWLADMQSHIKDLGLLGHEVNGNPAQMMLDIRVQPGGAQAAKQLVDFGKQFNVTVKVSEIQ